MDKQFASIREAAKITGLPEGFLRNMAHNGTLPGFKSGVKHVINMAKLQELIDRDFKEEKEN